MDTPEPNTTSVLGLTWTFGLNRAIPNGIRSLFSRHRNTIFYAAAHTGVVYDYEKGTQRLLQGHCNQITTLTTSSDIRFLVTGDKGPDSMLIVWDTDVNAGDEELEENLAEKEKENNTTAPVPIKTIFDLHGGSGVVAAEFTCDSRFLVTLGNDTPQTLAIWDWTKEKDEPIRTHAIEGGEVQTTLKLSPTDPYELLTNGPHTISFYTWTPDSPTLTQYTPTLSPKDFPHPPKGYTTSTFLPPTESDSIAQAITATTEGDIVVWSDRNLNNLSQKMEKGRKSGIKMMRVHNGGIGVVEVFKGVVVTGGEDGFVRVFDLQFRLLIWYERLRSGPIISITSGPNSWVQQDEGSGNLVAADEEKRVTRREIPDLIVGTRWGKVVLVGNPGVETGKAGVGNPPVRTLLEGSYDIMFGMAVHPKLERFAVGGVSGWVQMWDYTTKQLVTSQRFEEPREQLKDANGQAGHGKGKGEVLKIRSMAFSRDGEVLAIGFTNGTLRILSSTTLTDLPQSTPANKPGLPGYAVAKTGVTRICFSEDGEWMAVADEGCGVGVLRYGRIFGKGVEWGFVGRCRGHYGEIVGLLFVPPAPDTNLPRLISISHDRHMVEYDLQNSSITAGVLIKSKVRIDQTYHPLAATLHPSPPIRGPNDAPQYYVLTANSGGKFRIYNAETGMCRRTVGTPGFGANIRCLDFVKGKEEGEGYLVYATAEKVIGIQKLPLDGNPHKSMGLISHPGPISHIIPTPSGTHLLTLGQTDGIINLYTLNPLALETQIALSGTGIDPYLDLLFPRSDIPSRDAFVREMEDYFYYAQLRSQGEDAIRTRRIEGLVPVAEVPLIMQAMGYYPSLQEVEDLVNEVRYERWFGGFVGDLRGEVSFEELIKLYINHKPITDYTESEILSALSHAKRLEPGGPPYVEGPPPPIKTKDKIVKEGLMSLLQQYGETMSSSDFIELFRNLLLNDPAYNGGFPDTFTPKEFVEGILGLVPQLVGEQEERVV